MSTPNISLSDAGDSLPVELEALKPAIFLMACRYCGAYGAATDLAQETFRLMAADASKPKSPAGQRRLLLETMHRVYLKRLNGTLA